MRAVRETSADGSLHPSLEALHLAGGIDDVLGAGEEGVTIRADLYPNRLHGRADREIRSTGAMNLGLMVLRVDAFLHELDPSATMTLTRLVRRVSWLNLTVPDAVANKV
jgi:hypothetical protein